MQPSTVVLKDLLGTVHRYTAYSMNGPWLDLPGNYAFARPTLTGWIILYLGENLSFQSRMSCHERWAEALRLGATHVLARVNQGGEAARKAEERALIAAYNPVMNTQHRPPPRPVTPLGGIGMGGLR